MSFNISPSNIFLTILLPASFHQNCQPVLAAVSINGLKRVTQSNGKDLP